MDNHVCKTWKISPRKHGRPGRIFVECVECGKVRQASTAYGGLRTYTTAVDRGGKSTLHSLRLSPDYERRFREQSLSVGEIVRQYLDGLQDV